MRKKQQPERFPKGYLAAAGVHPDTVIRGNRLLRSQTDLDRWIEEQRSRIVRPDPY